MSLRITGGTAGGRILRGDVASGVRPTSERVREAIFSILGQDLRDERVLDAFGGAGMVGLECWSRGAEVVIYERERRAYTGILERARQIGATVEVRCADVLKRPPQSERFDGVFIDPPYRDGVEDALAVLAPLASAWVIVETPQGVTLPPTQGRLALDKQRRYGGTLLWVYR